MSKNSKKIAFISTCWNDNEYRKLNNKYGGVSYYRLVKPMELLRSKYDVTFYGSDINKASEGMSQDEFYDWLTDYYDMLIVKQIDNATAAQALIHWSNKNKCILVQDYDDNMLRIREDQPAYKMGYNPGGTRWAYAASMMSLTDALIVSTQPLKDYFGKFLKENFKEEKDVYIFPNFNDIKDWEYKQPKKDKNKIVLGWAGSITHDADLKIIMSTLGKILDKYENVYLELLGGILQGSLATLIQGFSKNAKDKVKVIFGTPAWDKFPGLMMSQKWDIGLAPLLDDEFNRSKSHIKWMEYTMMGIPTIASDVYPYSKNIQDKSTGFLVKDDEWEDKISLLIENKDLRDSIAKSAYIWIENNLQWSQHAIDYVKIVDEIFDKHYKK